MRLLQLASGPDELLDLHPNVTVVTGLQPEARRRLVDAVAALARGGAPDVEGLLEAHDVLFALAPAMLSLLDVTADDLNPIVTAADLPDAHRDPRTRARRDAQRTLEAAEARASDATEELAIAARGAARAGEALERARQLLDRAAADAAGRIAAIDAMAADVDHAVEERRRLEEERGALVVRVEEATARRVEVEAGAAEVLARRQQAVARSSELVAQLDDARAQRDPGVEAALEAAAADLAADLAAVEAEVEAEQEAAGEEPGPPDCEPPSQVLERIEEQLAEIDRRLAAFGSANAGPVARALEPIRSLDREGPVPVPEAIALADQLAELEGDLAATAGAGTTPGVLAEGRARVDDARNALAEAEQAVRTRHLDPDKVARLEDVHDRLLEVIDKADGRFGGARARRQVDAIRAEEHAILDELGFTSYSDYMIGYSLIPIDPDKQAAVDAARAELAAAEDAWQALEADTQAELARAQRLERHRRLLADARALTGTSDHNGSPVDALRALRRRPEPAPELLDALSGALAGAGVALRDEDLERDDLVLLADLLVNEAAEAAPREHELRTQREALLSARADALEAAEAEANEAGPDEPGPRDPERLRARRLAAAHEHMRATQARQQAQVELEARIASLTRELADATEEERRAAEGAAEAEAAIADAVQEEDAQREALDRLDEALAAAERAEADGNEALRAQQAGEPGGSPDDLEKAVADAEGALAEAEARVTQLTDELAALDGERTEAAAALETLDGEPAAADPGPDVSPVAEEIEWYLLARLAAQRAVSLGGSVPLLLDDALVDLDEGEVARVLGRLERMADAVQVIVLSEDPAVVSWAEAAGDERAAVVRPQEASAS